MKLLIKYTTRGRVDRFFDGMNSIYDLCSDIDNIRVLITADIDDTEMANQSVRDRVSDYKNSHIIYGTSTGKINAINRDLDILPDGFKDYDVLVNFSDDMRMIRQDWDKCIISDFERFGLDYYIAYLDEDTKGALSTMFIAGVDWVKKFNFIYDPVFLSLFADNLVEDCAKYRNKYHYTGYSIYKHLLPAYGHLEGDKMWEEQQELGYTKDMVTYNKIISNGITEYLKQFDL